MPSDTSPPLERSQTTVRLVEAVGVQLREQEQTHVSQGVAPNHGPVVGSSTPVNPGEHEFSTAVLEKPNRRGGRQQMPDSQEKVAAEMGGSVGMINETQQHLKAAELLTIWATEPTSWGAAT